uniref:Uncharacterized protein n=1 Tax=Caenorhabditis japonica TaxID=281687 RepID=A0A8R1I9H0_CAEJA
MDAKGFDKIKTIHTNWYVHSMKALIAQLSRNILPKLSDESKQQFVNCLSTIHDKKDLVNSAKCVMSAREQYNVERVSRPRITKTKKLEVAPQLHIRKITYKSELLEKKRKMLATRFFNDDRIMELKKKNLKIKMAEFKRKWRSGKRAKRSLQRLVVDSVSKSDADGFFVKTMSKMPQLKTKSASPVERVAGLLRAFLTNQTKSDPTWSDTYRALINLKKKMDEKEKESGARVYNERMYDLVLDIPQKDQGLGFYDKKKMPSMMRHAFDLMSTIEKTSGRKGDSNIKILSPRFASVMPDKNENRGRLSPSILSFYNDESEDQILPLPKMLDATGMGGKDRDTILELVMEVSGVKGIVHDAMKMLKSTEMPELFPAMNDNAKKLLQMVQDIQKSYNPKQRREMKSNGFTLLDPKQMEKLMTEQGISGRDDIFNLKEYAVLTMKERREMVWDMIRGIAYGITGTKAPNNNGTGGARVKRQGVWGPHILQPTVLSPILFTPIYGLNVLGPTVLSPGLFTPLILNPAVLSPYVFSPTVGIPFILSPYVLSPYVFSPLIMAPFILNPYVLSPNVFNPYVLSPLVLSPLVLCPDVVSPMTLGGAILSPAVLSPSVLSKSLKDPPSSPISKFSNLLLTLLRNTTSSEAEEKWASTFRRMKKLNKNLNRSRSATFRTIKHRAYDLVLDDDSSDADVEIPVPISDPLIQDGLQLLSTLTGNRKNSISARILSPRIAPLTSSHTRGILSPSIFPFYNDEVEEQLFPIPDLIEKSGFEESEKNKLLAFLMEISRTRPILDEAMKVVKLLNPEKQQPKAEENIAVLSATDKMSKEFEQLEKSLSQAQKQDLRKTGFSLLEMPQMESLFGKYDVSSVLQEPQMQSYSNYTSSERQLALWKSIENLAYPYRRTKRGRTVRVGDVTVYTALNPTILAPYMFSPVYGLSVLGPVIFSPNIFSPLILNPAVLSPWIFSPAFPLPFILSPYVLSPYIFSPLVMAPFILNPYVLSPNVFNPYVLSPLVLSPLFLCPDVFSPMVLGGVILSPNSFSPSVFSKSYIMAAVLSPTVLSK